MRKRIYQVVQVLTLGLIIFLVACRNQDLAPADLTIVPPSGESTTDAVQVPVPLPTARPMSTKLEFMADGFFSPLGMAAPNDGTGRLFVYDQAGYIWVLQPGDDQQFERLPEPLLDLREKMVPLVDGYDERGFLGLALHPDFTENGRLFVYYSAPLDLDDEGFDHASHLSEFFIPAGKNKADPSTEQVIMQINQPTPAHNGGDLAFGPDEYLYIALGDGGPGHDPGNRAQDLNQLFGKILRIDIDSASDQVYGIPADNPFANSGGLPEIYAYGFRNPFRISFDAAGSNQLFVGDVGHDNWEEVNLVVPGGNYGWSVREGTGCFSPPTARNPITNCADRGEDGNRLQQPFAAYDHVAGAAIIGGYVYRGDLIDNLEGSYIFADWGWQSGKLFATSIPISEYTPEFPNYWPIQELKLDENGEQLEGRHVLGFGQDTEKELFLFTSKSLSPLKNRGEMFKLMPSER